MNMWNLVLLLLAGPPSSFATDQVDFGPPLPGTEDLMSPKSSGSCTGPILTPLRWGSDAELANKISCHNRDYAEQYGYWTRDTSFFDEASALPAGQTITFFDSVSGLPVFQAPRGRSMEAFLQESRSHGWPSFRDEEVVSANVRVLADGETVSINGTHLGHNLPDGRNRYCINLVSVAASAPACGIDNAAVYFGNGCFWHTQYDLFTVETSPPFSRSLSEATARVGYAGGNGAGTNGQVCYHGGPAGTFYGEPAGMHYAEAVQVMLDSDQSVAFAQFVALCQKYFGETFRESVRLSQPVARESDSCWLQGGQMIRGDPQDAGPDYRNVIGIPGGLSGPLGDVVVDANVHSMELLPGGVDGDSTGDSIDEVYDSLEYPFYRGERYHQYHKNVVMHRDVPESYLINARQAAIDRGWIDETCSSDAPISNLERAPCEVALLPPTQAPRDDLPLQDHGSMFFVGLVVLCALVGAMGVMYFLFTKATSSGTNHRSPNEIVMEDVDDLPKDVEGVPLTSYDPVPVKKHHDI